MTLPFNIKTFLANFKSLFYKWIAVSPEESAATVKQRIIKVSIQVGNNYKINIKMATTSNLEDAVKEATVTNQIAIACIKKQSEEKDKRPTQEAIQALIDQIKANTDALNAAISAANPA